MFDGPQQQKRFVDKESKPTKQVFINKTLLVLVCIKSDL